MRLDQRPHPPRRQERGAALLTVLLLVAVIAVIAGTTLEKLRLTTRIAGNAVSGQQAQGYARAAETLALGRIDTLLGQAEDRVTLVGGWSDQPFGLPLPGGGNAVARVVDGGNCFNLNGLVTRSGPGLYASAPPMVEQFARLLRLVGIPALDADHVSASAADWIDSDQAPNSNGAEDGAYLTLQTPYRTGGTLMADPSELRAVAGVTPEIYTRVRPYLCTLPIAAASRINVNTVSLEQAPLVAMLLPDTLSVDAARQMILRRPPQGFASASDFWKAAALNGATGGPGSDAQSATTTKWFALTIDVTLGDTHLTQRALVDATHLPAQLVSRQWGEQT